MKQGQLPVTVAVIVLVTVVAMAVTAIWFVLRPRAERAALPPSDDFVEQFYVGVAALDIDDNDRARRIFESLSAEAPHEPAVWANLALAHLRISNLEAARQVAARAAPSAHGDVRIVVLQARIEEMLGELDGAIERLRRAPDKDVDALYLLVQLIERTRRDDAAAQQLELINEILDRQPDNLVARFKQARLAAQLANAPLFDDSLSRLARDRDTWPAGGDEEFAAVRKAAEAGDFREALTHLTRLENLTRSHSLYLESLATLGISGNTIGQPVREFLVMPAPPAAVAEVDLNLQFEVQAPPGADEAEFLLAGPLTGHTGATLFAFADGTVRVGDLAPLDFPGATAENAVSRSSLQVADLNGDFREDLVLAGETGCVVYLQDESRQFAAWSPGEAAPDLFAQPSDGVWVLDVEPDGDLDLVVSRPGGPPRSLRNNGDMTFSDVEFLPDLPALHDFLWLDVDNDGDADVAILDREGHVLFYGNERSGRFLAAARPFGDTRLVALAAGDVRRDGSFSLVALDADGNIRQAMTTGDGDAWETAELARWDETPDLASAFASRRVRLHLADFDNNGAVDVVASAGTRAAIWLGSQQPGFQRLAQAPAMFVASVADVDGDGRLDLVGIEPQGPRIARNTGRRDYRWQFIETRAAQSAGDGRFNSFGLGGRIELRAGRLVQAAPIDAARNHFGLGRYQRAGVARIVWPNGTVQVEFDLEPNRVVTSQQRLKGSCPYVFAHDGSGLRFVKDFIWRSPLGLRINAQDTAGVTQTEDWIKIPGRLLAERDGMYELRITAELWETHFFDSISLMAVDHPEEIDIWADERFVAASNPELRVTATTPPRPLDGVYDHHGTPVSELTRAIDGRYVDSFALGRFQGVAEEHWVEFRLPAELPSDAPLFLIGHGWVYPTDSSLNVAMAQGDFPRPSGLVLDAQDEDGVWRTATSDLGFPAGKNKTVVLPLPGELLSQGKRRFRLRTNLEVYWDYLGWAAKSEARLRTTRLGAAAAELRYRGFSETAPPERRKPDIPRYDRLSGTRQRWRDLEGFYTRFGDVRELLDRVDDRYVIMNAGDEIVLRFPAPPFESHSGVQHSSEQHNGEQHNGEPAGLSRRSLEGTSWTRDFILIGDGWVKDGDYNTSFSRTVRPLPTHDNPDYSVPPGALADDPVYRRFPDDWQRYHTRYVTPGEFARGLWPPLELPTFGNAKH